MTAYANATEKDIEQAVYNCYPTPAARFDAVIHYRRYGVFPFNPQLN